MDYQKLVQNMQQEMNAENVEPEPEPGPELEPELEPEPEPEPEHKPELKQEAKAVSYGADYQQYILMAGLASLLLSTGAPRLAKISHFTSSGGQLNPLGIAVGSLLLVAVFVAAKRLLSV